MTLSPPHWARWRGLFLLALSACGKSTPPSRDPLPADSAATTTTPPPSAPPPSAPPPSAPAATDPLPDAGAPAAPIVADNKVAPTEGPELQQRAKGLFQAIVADEPERAEALWFPREPFLPLKDMKDPGQYWEQLHRTFVNDIHALHRKRKRWDGAELVGFEGWSRPKWVPPGDEANKIGYHRAFNGQLRYTIDGEAAAIEVHTLITWQGLWYVTHLRRVKK